MIALVFFWLAVALIVYEFVGFILILAVRSWLWPRPYQTDENYEPTVSMVIAAYNEADVIEVKLKNIQALDYPTNKLEVIIASDGSDDGTNDIVSRYAGEVVKLLALSRQGKTGTLNTAVSEATGEILVFSDANTQYAPDAIRALLRPFADPKVGGVAGDQRYLSASGDMSGSGERTYWSFDRILKQLESRGGNVISSTGAIHAIRRSLFQTIPEGTIDDAQISLRVIAQGYRLVFAGDALAYEPVAQSLQREFGRKVRNLTMGLTTVVVNRELLNPFRFGFYSLQLFTHKLLRRLMYIPMIMLIVTNPFLVDDGLFYILTMLGQIGFYGVAIGGWLLQKRGVRVSKLVAVPMYVCMVYFAAMIASWRTLTGNYVTRWSTER